MAITYPLNLPTTPAPASITMSATNVVGYSESPFTLQGQSHKHQGERWSCDITTPPMKRETAESWIAFLLSLRGRYGTFLVGDSARKSPLGSVSGAVTVYGAAQTGESITVAGLGANNPDVFQAGDYIQIGTGVTSRLYKILQNVTSDVSGRATMDIWPRLSLTPVNGSTVVYQSPKGLFRLPSNEISWTWEPGVFTSLTFGAIAV